MTASPRITARPLVRIEARDAPANTRGATLRTRPGSGCELGPVPELREEDRSER
jgi:hypothetical protein